MKQKYIVFKDGTATVFSTDSFHCYMTGGKEVLSAGFYEDGKCFGESTTLGVKSRLEDSEILANLAPNL